MPNIDKKKAAEFQKGFEAGGGISPSEAWENLKKSLGGGKDGKEEAQKASKRLLSQRASQILKR